MANDKKLNKKEKKEKKRFFKDFKAELKRVTWPTGKQLVNNTIAVVTIVLITAAIVFVLDLGFEMLNKYGINKLKSTLNNDTNTVVENNTATPDTTTDNNTTEGQDNGETTEVTPSPVAEQ